MATKPRNLLKTRAQRLAEVLLNVHEKAGQADSNVVIWPVTGRVVVGSTTTRITANAGEVVLGQAIVAHAVSANVQLPAGAATTAGQWRKVLVSRAADGTVSLVPGTASVVDQASAALPADEVDKIAVAYLEIPPSFVVDTTVVTTGMIKDVLYHQ